MPKKRLYSPNQVAISSFLGGPFAAVYVLKKNFDVLGNEKESRKVLIWGAVFNILLFAVLPFLPQHFPNVAIPIGYSVGAQQAAEKFQMSKKAILDSDQYGFQSNWNVIGVSAGFFVAFVLTFGLGLLGLIGLGWF